MLSLLPPWMFYDTRGSRIFEQITELPEYYPSAQSGILTTCCDAIIAAACPDRSDAIRLVELGAGTPPRRPSCSMRPRDCRARCYLFRWMCRPMGLDVACESIANSLPEISVSPIVSNYVTHPPQLESFGGPTLALYIGSSMGNFSPREAQTILRNLRSQLQSGDALLLGLDMVKDEPTLVAAYDDKNGVTAEFNLNMLHRLNREDNAISISHASAIAPFGMPRSRVSRCTLKVPATNVCTSLPQTSISISQKANAFTPRTATNSRVLRSALYLQKLVLNADLDRQTRLVFPHARTHPIEEHMESQKNRAA